MIKHIFSDLDGTLYNGSITERDFQAICLAQEFGIKFHIATGRVYSHMLSIISETDVKGYLICENGSFIYNNEGECLYKGTLDDMQIKRIVDFYNKIEYIDKASDIMYFKYDGKVILPIEGASASYFSKGYEIDSDIFTKESYNSLVGNIGILTLDREKLERLVKDYQTHFCNEFDIYISSPTTMNIVPRGVSKFDAIKMVCKKEGATLDEIVTIGDSPNDISMLKNVKMSFAMSTADKSVKAVAGFETPSVADAVKMVIDLNSELEST